MSKPLFIAVALAMIAGSEAFGVAPEVAELSFDTRWQQAPATNTLPVWILGVEQAGGQFGDQPPSWSVDASQPVGVGRLAILLDRRLMQENLAVSVLYEEDQDADFAVQLFDAENRVVSLDLFGNLMAVGKEAKTDTFIVPLRKFPTATKITFRRIRGSVRVYGAALYPVVTEAEADIQTLEQLARLLGDPLSPENPLVKAIQNISNNSRTPVRWLPGPVRDRPSTGGGATSGAQTLGGFDWYILPFPVNSDWPGPKGDPAKWDNGELILTGQPVRSRRSYSVPVTISYETTLEQRSTHDGGLTIMFEPEGVPLDHQGEQEVTFAIGYGRNGTDDGSSHLQVWQLLALRENFHPVGKLLWEEEAFKFDAGELYRVTLEIRADGMRATINGRTYEVNGVTVPYRRFHVAIGGWQPGNRWHVRNVNIR